MRIAAGTDDVDGIRRRFDRDHFAAHRDYGADQFIDRLAFFMQAGKEGVDLFRRNFAFENVIESVACFLGGQILPALDFLQGRFKGHQAVAKKFFSSAWPCSVAMLSG